jgi:hypothetical protein
VSASLYICMFKRFHPCKSACFPRHTEEGTPLMLIFSTKHPLHISHPLPY